MRIHRSTAGIVLVMSTDSAPQCPRIVVESNKVSLRDDYEGRLLIGKSLITRFTRAAV